MSELSLGNHSSELINSRLWSFENKSSKLITPEILKRLHSCIDLTSLAITDTNEKIIDFTKKVNVFKRDYPEIPNVAAICVYPKFVAQVRDTLMVPNLKIAAVAGGFPHSQTFLKVKLMEIELAVNAGADEIDVVINVGDIISENIKKAGDEIAQMKQACKDAQLKVILESGAYQYDSDLYNAAVCAMENGADFIKTSTGKMQPSATPRASLIMCLAIKDYEKLTGKRAGFKAAGGIKTAQDAIIYYAVMKDILGEDRIHKDYLRFGATSLSKNLVNDITENK